MRQYGLKRIKCWCDTPLYPCWCEPAGKQGKRRERQRARRAIAKDTTECL